MQNAFNKVLMIEPNLIRANLYTELLEEQGWRVDCAESVRDALNKIENDTQASQRTVLISPQVVQENTEPRSARKKDTVNELAQLLNTNVNRILLMDDLLRQHALLN